LEADAVRAIFLMNLVFGINVVAFAERRRFVFGGGGDVRQIAGRRLGKCCPWETFEIPRHARPITVACPSLSRVDGAALFMIAGRLEGLEKWQMKLVLGRMVDVVFYLVWFVAALGIWIFCIAADPLLGALLGWIPGFTIFRVKGAIDEHRAAIESEPHYRDERARAATMPR
jgi:hypothetical protein